MSIYNEISNITQIQNEVLKEFIETGFLDILGSAFVYLRKNSDEAPMLDNFTEEQKKFLEKYLEKRSITDDEVLNNVANIFDLSQLGNPEIIEPLKKEMNKNSSKENESIIEELKDRNPLLANVMQENLLVFEDLLLFSGRDLFKLIRRIDQADLAIALKGTNEQFQNEILTCFSKNAATTIREDMEFMGPISSEKIQQKQKEILNVAQDLIKKGNIKF